MKHSHWSFEANTETFDGRRAVKEAWAAGLQIVSFETEDYAVTLATEEFVDGLRTAGVGFEVHDHASNDHVWVPVLSADTLDSVVVPSADLPPYVYSLDHTADQVRAMIAKLRKPQRVAVSGYGREAGANTATTPDRDPAPDTAFVWQGPGVYMTRDGYRQRVVSHDDDVYPYSTPHKAETYGACGQVYAQVEEGSCTTGDDLVGGKVAEL